MDKFKQIKETCTIGVKEDRNEFSIVEFKEWDELNDPTCFPYSCLDAGAYVYVYFFKVKTNDTFILALCWHF